MLGRAYNSLLEGSGRFLSAHLEISLMMKGRKLTSSALVAQSTAMNDLLEDKDPIDNDNPMNQVIYPAALHDMGIVSRLRGRLTWLKQRTMMFSLHTIWLFTLNDLKSIVCPETAFAFFSALSGRGLTTNATPCLSEILGRLPQIIVWNWVNLLLFDVANQRLPQSILEDTVNKPWRPMPSKRLTHNEARRFLLVLLPIVFLVSTYLGGLFESLALMSLTWMYNDLGGADENYIVRNLINACGFVCYSSGATTIAAGYGQNELNRKAWIWLAIVGAIVFSTLQMQDMADMEGDAVRGRRTLPLVHGETVARWSVAVRVAAWSFICPAFWESGVIGYGISVATGSVLIVRVLLLKGRMAYRKTWAIWCFWTMTLYLLPLLKEDAILRRILSDLKHTILSIIKIGV